MMPTGAVCYLPGRKLGLMAALGQTESTKLPSGAVTGNRSVMKSSLSYSDKSRH